MPRITEFRMREVLGPAPKPKIVWQKQFDGNQDTLESLARSDWDKIPPIDLWDYFHDLAYQELQPDLFRHVFPACLKFWYATLMQNESTEVGSIELHSALLGGDILHKVLTETERMRLQHFFIDGFLDRIDMERGVLYDRDASNAWIGRFNSLGLFAPVIPLIWREWWSLDTPGKAVSAMKYASGLVFLPGENPLYPAWTAQEGGGGPYLEENDSNAHGAVWLEENVAFFQQTLTSSYVVERMKMVARKLDREPESEIANQVLQKAERRADIVAWRIEDLIAGFSRPA